MMETAQKSEKTSENLIPKKPKRKYNLIYTGFRQRVEQSLDDNQKLINKLKNELCSQDQNTLFEMQKTLIKFDVDKSGYIDLDEFNKLLSEYNLNLTPNDTKTIFTCFDPTHSGKIFYKDLINIIHSTLDENRQKLVDELYTKLCQKQYPLDIKTVLGNYNSKNMGQENSDTFKNNFLTHHDYYGKPKNPTINYEEFLDFFENLSINYPQYENFEKYLNSAFTEEENVIEENENNLNQNVAKEFLDNLDKLRNIILKQSAKGIVNLLKNLHNVDLANSNGIDLDEFITVIQTVLKDSDGSFPVKEIHNIFNIYDTQEKGIMEYKKFLSDLLKLTEMPKSRKELLTKIFTHLDFEGKGTLDINEMLLLYKRPEHDSPNPVPDLLESFVIYHNVVRGKRNPLVNVDDFVDFYKNINLLIPVTKNDQLFIDFTSETWCLNDKTFDERKNLAISKLEGLGKQKNRGMMNKLIGSQKTPYGINKDKINYNFNDGNATIKYNLNKIEDVILHLRDNIIKRGTRGIMSLRRTFMLMDENNNKKVEFAEFENIFKKYRFNISDEEINSLFRYFDKDNSGYIDYGEFVNGITGNLNDFRKEVLKQVFEKLDKNEVGKISVGQLRKEYNPKGNPLVRQGKRSEDEVLADFIDVLEYHFNLLNEKTEENVDINDILIDFDEFCDFYKNISVCVDEDKYFEIMILGEWGLKKDGKSPYQKTWNQQDA